MGEYGKSLKHYQRANSLLDAEGDTFGTAYSFCGIANAHRMEGRFEEALEYFSQATGLYREIGDRVSYAYTLWGEGTALKVMGRLAEAKERFLSAHDLFSATGDIRGMIYTLLSLGEIDLLEGRKEKMRKALKETEEILSRYPFRLERCHLLLYRSLLGEEDIERAIDAYRRQGSRFPSKKPSFPLNLP